MYIVDIQHQPAFLPISADESTTLTVAPLKVAAVCLTIGDSLSPTRINQSESPIRKFPRSLLMNIKQEKSLNTMLQFMLQFRIACVQIRQGYVQIRPDRFNGFLSAKN